MKAAFDRLDTYTKSRLFTGTITKAKIIALPLDSYSYLELLGLFSLFDLAIVEMLIKAKFTARSLKGFTAERAAEFIDVNRSALQVKSVRKNINKSLRTSVWNTYLNASEYKAMCWSCNSTEINRDNFHCGHVVSANSGGDSTLDNLRPVCVTCNLSMGTQDMDEFIEECGYSASSSSDAPDWLDKYNKSLIFDGDCVRPEYAAWYEIMSINNTLLL